MTTDESTLEEQAEVVSEFLEGLLDAFDMDAEIEQVPLEDDLLELRIEGEDLGVLIGPKGQTLSALQELSRTVTQRQLAGATTGRVRVDVAGYRQRRREALERFARKIADEVLDSGSRRVLEPMPPPDRKVIHDAINLIEGVTTTSEGDEPRRRVVVLPE